MFSEILWPAAGLAFGVAVGLLFVGYLLKPAILHWESSASLQRLFFAVGAFLVGGGGGTAVMATFSNATPWYLLGIGVGVIWGCFHKPVLIVSHTYESVSQVVQLSEAFRDRVTDLEERSATILAVLAPPRSTKKTAKQLGSALENALDAASDEDQE